MTEPPDRNYRAIFIGTVVLAIIVVITAVTRGCQAGFPPLH